jgi:hypothetical protein
VTPVAPVTPAAPALRTAILYYGAELPANRAATAALRGAAVVLQPYHPLLLTGRFADYFPGCSLFVYWNPTGLPAAELQGAGRDVRLLDADPVWNLARLDLRSPATRRFAVRRGLRVLRAAGPAAAGLFVDDLDLWAAADQEAAFSVVDSVAMASSRSVRLFVNRGFWFWPRLPDIAAVLLENLTPGLVDRMNPADQLWVRQQVLPAVRQVRRRGAACLGLTYQPGPEAGPQGAVSRQLAEVTDGVLVGRRALDEWPEEFQ